jgi:hypothetical protein
LHTKLKDDFKVIHSQEILDLLYSKQRVLKGDLGKDSDETKLTKYKNDMVRVSLIPDGYIMDVIGKD